MPWVQRTSGPAKKRKLQDARGDQLAAVVRRVPLRHRIVKLFLKGWQIACQPFFHGVYNSSGLLTACGSSQELFSAAGMAACGCHACCRKNVRAAVVECRFIEHVTCGEESGTRIVTVVFGYPGSQGNSTMAEPRSHSA